MEKESTNYRSYVNVDIVADNGNTWILVKNLKPFGKESPHWKGDNTKDGLKAEVEDLLKSARQNPNNGIVPKIVIEFPQGVTCELAQELEKMGVEVGGNQTNIEPNYQENSSKGYLENTDYFAAIFFIPKENKEQNQPIEVLLEKAGATNINRPAPDRLIDCYWAEMSCKAYTEDELESHQLLVIKFFDSFFYKGQPISSEKEIPLEEDGNLKLALTFRDACETLSPEVAYIVTHLQYAEFDWILKTMEKIEAYDPDDISDEAALVYFRGILADWLTYPRPLRPQESLPVKEGLLLFHGTGTFRWG